MTHSLPSGPVVRCVGMSEEAGKGNFRTLALHGWTAAGGVTDGDEVGFVQEAQPPARLLAKTRDTSKSSERYSPE